jgi:hypothetical protein
MKYKNTTYSIQIVNQLESISNNLEGDRLIEHIFFILLIISIHLFLKMKYFINNIKK